MRKLAVICSFMLLLVSCKDEPKIEKEILEIPVQFKVDRFDQAFFETKPEELSKLKSLYPEFFPANVSDQQWIEKMTNPLWKELYQEVQKKYGNFDTKTQDIELFFKHAIHYFPSTKVPKVIALIGEMDYESKIIYNGEYLLIALELYLGKEHEYYKAEFPTFISQNFEDTQILPDIATQFGMTKVRYPLTKSFIELMLYEGKLLYLKDLTLPTYKDEDKIGYTKEQLDWAATNEADIWKFFIEGNILYSTDNKLASRFINPAPFSKFYLEIDNESPGRIGSYLGWQIVRSFMKNNNIPLEDMLQMDAAKIFNMSKYKPKK